MRLITRTCSLSLALLAVLTSTAAAQSTMRFQFKENDRLQYVIEQKTKSVASLMGAEIVSHTNLTINLVWEVLKVDSQGAQIKIKATHSKMSLDSLLGKVDVDSNDKGGPADATGRIIAQLNKAFATMEITATMLPTGEMKDIKVSEATVKAMKAIPNADKLGDVGHPDNFKDMLTSVVFPTEPISKGKTWTRKHESQTPEGKTTTEQNFTFEDTVEQDGARLEKITLRPKITVVPDPKAMMKVTSVKASGHALFDNKTGRFVESTISQTKQGKISVMGIGLDNNSEQTTIVRLKIQSAEEKIAAAKKIQSVKIDEDDFVEKVVAKEQLETIAGVSRSFSLQRSFEPAITMTGSAPVSDELKAKVESALELTIGKKATVKETITLDGKEITKLNIVWVERSRRGVATTSDGTVLQFTVKVGLRFKLEKAK